MKNNIVQKKILSVKIKNRNLRFKISQEIPLKLSNAIITKIIRRGKYLIFLCSNDCAILIHLGMTGYFRTEKFYKKKKHDHILFILNDDNLVFNDIRKFGFIKIYKKEEVFISFHIKNLGPEPLSLDFSIEYFLKHLNRKTNIKNLLMNQRFVSGLGNIYCSEILFDSNIHPERSVQTIKKNEVKNLINSAKKILHNAIELGGTTIKNFIVSNEKIGYFKNKLNVYGRENLPCTICGKKSRILKIVQSGRSTFYCSKCQK